MNSGYNIEYLYSFDEEFDEILYYISHNLKNKIAAEKLLEDTNQAIVKRSISPEAFEKYKYNDKHTWYKIYVSNFIILYTVSNNTMKIAHIFYSKRNIEELI